MESNNLMSGTGIPVIPLKVAPVNSKAVHQGCLQDYNNKDQSKFLITPRRLFDKSFNLLVSTCYDYSMVYTDIAEKQYNDF